MFIVVALAALAACCCQQESSFAAAAAAHFFAPYNPFHGICASATKLVSSGGDFVKLEHRTSVVKGKCNNEQHNMVEKILEMLLLVLVSERQSIFKKIVSLNFKGIADLIRHCKYSSILNKDL